MKGIFAVAALLAVIAIVVMMPVDATQEEADEVSQNVPGTPGTFIHYLKEIGVSLPPLGAAISPVVTEIGKITWSIDGLGVYPGTTGTIQVEKPAGATVKSAYMAAATTGFSGYKLLPGNIKIDDADVAWTYEIENSIGSYNYWADVTSLVKAKIDAAPAGKIDFIITETPEYETDGEMLVVIFDDPAQTTDNTIILMFGAQQTTGDNFNILLAEPIDTADPNLALDFSLASSYSYQEGFTGQYSIVDVNGIRMTSSAGGDDDGTGERSNGELFTVGGLDDLTDNPADPNALPDNRRYDDELYTLLPFVSNGDASILVHTLNPSNDDNLLFAGLFLRSVTASVGQILLAPASATNIIGAMHTVTATVQDGDGNLVAGEEVTFTVTSGPNAGTTGVGTTDANGQAQYSYTGNLAGVDTITASFVDDSGTTITSNEVTKTWEEPPHIQVSVDIKPGSCPNPLNMADKGVLPASILGTDEFNVYNIDPSTIRLGLADTIDEKYVSPTRFAFEDVATPYEGEEDCGCHELGSDGKMDLTLKFEVQDLVGILKEEGVTGTFPLIIMGNLKEEFDGTSITGSDCVVLKPTKP